MDKSVRTENIHVTSTKNVVIRWASSPRDYKWLQSLWVSRWGGETMVSHGQFFKVTELKAFLATDQGKIFGALTFSANPGQSECVSLDALAPRMGIGTALLNAWESWARHQEIERLWLITSNDNLNALRFYQKRGFRLCRLYPGAVDAARLQKPEIPLLGETGIPIHDEIELEKWIGTESGY
ncbi:MAG: GNAT family N-acetyltransferase [Sulfobacillus benefaciens]|jgi:GNAT superfamily N-acetyltransferase|uniref:GNAT family N-acetyltransferase n=1 Tax=Sulfobacillus benefaciens TaxID=453960 RepID=A0A2T2X0J5_9FIRM|nr:MAG: GNAT family N-acetyltransferase [Sulfobacillus benefaciens]